MRFLHTGDWHVGKTIRGRSRVDESERALAQVVDIAVTEGVDALLVAGDVYEQRAASPEADRLVFDTLARLSSAGIPVVAVAGNHDSPARFEAFARLLAAVDVHLVARVRRPDAGGLLPLVSRDGKESALVACVPFVAERRFADAAEAFAAPESSFNSYAQGMAGILAGMEAAFRPDCVNLVVGHFFVDGARPGGGEREVTLGDAYSLPPGSLPATASYIALGHIHRPQEVRAARSPARYGGSLLQLDFGERDQAKSVTLIDVTAGKPARVESLAVDAGRKLLDVGGRLEDLPRIADQLGDAYLRVLLAVDRPTPGIADRVRDVLPNALDVSLDYERVEHDEAPSLRTLEPRHQFVSYYKSVHGIEPHCDLLTAFDDVLEAVEE
ncbi:exonuclease SbcCD subunit D [soil metagenome]